MVCSRAGALSALFLLFDRTRIQIAHITEVITYVDG